MGSNYKKLSHVVYKCDYHIVWTPKYRYRILFGEVKNLVENDIRMLCERKGAEVIKSNVQIDHVHVVVSIPPKVSVSILMGTLKGKLAKKIFKSYSKLKQKPNRGNHFWSGGYIVTTGVPDEETIQRFVQFQEEEDNKEENQCRNFDLFALSPEV